MRSSVKCAFRSRVGQLLVIAAFAAISSLMPRRSEASSIVVTPVPVVGLVSDVGKALDRLASVSKPFSLVPGVRVEKKEVVRPDVSRMRRATLVDSAERVFQDHDLVVDAAPGLQMRVTATGDGRGFRVMAQPSSRPSEGRTFGVMRRMKLVLLPIMYKLGVITTLLTLLTVFALKGLTIGVMLLIMGSVGLVHKLKVPYHEGYGHNQKDVHVHVHGGGISHGYSSPAIYHSAESPWDRNESPPTHHGPSHAPGYGQQPWTSQQQEHSWRYPHQMGHDSNSPWSEFIS